MVSRFISKIEEIVVDTLLVILVIFVSVNVVLRYFFGSSITGSVEISILLFVWISFIGTSLAFKKNSHITIEIFKNMISKRFKKSYLLVTNLILLVTFILMVFYGLSISMEVVGEGLGATKISMSLVYLAFPLGFSFMIIHLIDQTLALLRKDKEGKSK